MVERPAKPLMPAADIADVRPVVRLSMRPTPGNFARRRWGPSLSEEHGSEGLFSEKVSASAADEPSTSSHPVLGRRRLWPTADSDDTNENYSDEEGYSGDSAYSSEDEVCRGPLLLAPAADL